MGDVVPYEANQLVAQGVAPLLVATMYNIGVGELMRLIGRGARELGQGAFEFGQQVGNDLEDWQRFARQRVEARRRNRQIEADNQIHRRDGRKRKRGDNSPGAQSSRYTPGVVGYRRKKKKGYSNGYYGY